MALDDIGDMDITTVNIDPNDFNKIHDTVNINAQKMGLIQEMQKLRMQCANYKRQTIRLRQQMNQINVDKNEYNKLKKKYSQNNETRAQQRKVISRLYTQMTAYKQKDDKLKEQIEELKRHNKEWIGRYQSISANEKKYKEKALQYKQQLKEIVVSSKNNDNYNQQMLTKQVRQTLDGNKKKPIKKSGELLSIINVLQSQLKTKDLEATAMKRMLLKYKQMIRENHGKLHELSDKIHYLQKKKFPPKPITENKAIQTIPKPSNSYKQKHKKQSKRHGQFLNIQQENMNPNTTNRRHQKLKYMNNWLETIHNAQNSTILLDGPQTQNESITDMLHDLKIQLLERKLMQ